MKVFTGGVRIAFLIFFASHIPITLTIDGQAFIPEVLYPELLKNFVDWYAITFNDPLMSRPFDTWFSAMVSCEVFFQLPFFAIAVYMVLNSGRSNNNNNNHETITTRKKYPSWFQKACLIYGSHVCTTLIPIFAILGTNPNTNTFEKLITIGVYSPYFVFPAWLLYLAAIDDDDDDGDAVYALKKKK
mmetsp:Transcript_1812/g.2535  ORF Transcript_1812/g.2535 Transcript_1812/m.2535 type:complete len:187 (+) Transcript_1812:153-713(+)